MGLGKGIFLVSKKIFFDFIVRGVLSVPIHRVDVLGQRLLLQQVLPNGLKNKSLYLLGFEKGILLVSDKIFFENSQAVSSSQRAVINQAILTWQNDSFVQLVRPLYL